MHKLKSLLCGGCCDIKMAAIIEEKEAVFKNIAVRNSWKVDYYCKSASFSDMINEILHESVQGTHPSQQIDCNIDDLHKMNQKSLEDTNFYAENLNRMIYSSDYFSKFVDIGNYWHIHIIHYTICRKETNTKAIKLCVNSQKAWFSFLMNIRDAIAMKDITEFSKVLVYGNEVKENELGGDFNPETLKDQSWSKAEENDMNII